MTKRALKWPQHFSTTAALVALGIKSRIPIHKLTFLQRLLSWDTNGTAASTMHALLDDPDSICIVRECHELQAVHSLKLNDTIFCDAHSVHLRDVKEEVLLADKTVLLDLCATKAPLCPARLPLTKRNAYCHLVENLSPPSVAIDETNIQVNGKIKKGHIGIVEKAQETS